MRHPSGVLISAPHLRGIACFTCLAQVTPHSRYLSAFSYTGGGFLAGALVLLLVDLAMIATERKMELIQSKRVFSYASHLSLPVECDKIFHFDGSWCQADRPMLVLENPHKI